MNAALKNMNVESIQLDKGACVFFAMPGQRVGAVQRANTVAALVELLRNFDLTGVSFFYDVSYFGDDKAIARGHKSYGKRIATIAEALGYQVSEAAQWINQGYPSCKTEVKVVGRV